MIYFLSLRERERKSLSTYEYVRQILAIGRAGALRERERESRGGRASEREARDTSEGKAELLPVYLGRSLGEGVTTRPPPLPPPPPSTHSSSHSPPVAHGGAPVIPGG